MKSQDSISKIIFTVITPPRPERLWCPPSLLSSGY